MSALRPFTASKPVALVRGQHPTLRQAAQAVTPDERWIGLCCTLVATAAKTGGYAVAAPQIGQPWRIVGCRNGIAVANPEIVTRSTELEEAPEGCLSFPGRRYLVARSVSVTVAAVHPVTGESIGWECEGIDARLWQHECDHLDGLLIAGTYPEIRGVTVRA